MVTGWCTMALLMFYLGYTRGLRDPGAFPVTFSVRHDVTYTVSLSFSLTQRTIQEAVRAGRGRIKVTVESLVRGLTNVGSVVRRKPSFR